MNRDAYAHCEALVRTADKERFLASLFAAAEARPHLLALYAFNVEIARVRDAAREALPGEIRLQWWHDALTGGGHGEVAAHPVAGALLDSLARRQVSPQRLIELIEARRFDLYETPMATQAELDTYMGRTSAGLIATAAQMLGAADSPVLTQASHAAGLAQALTVLLNVVGPHAARRRLYVPGEVLAQHGVQPEEIFAGQASDGLRAALAALRAQARRHYADFLDGVNALPSAALTAFLPVTLAPQLLARMERRGYDPFSPVEVPQWRRQWALLRAAWFGFPAP